MQNKTKKKQAFKILRCIKLICQNMHTITNLSYVNTNITKVKLNIRHVIKKRATTFFVFLLFPLHILVQITKWKN